MENKYGMPIMKGMLFVSSFKSRENVLKMVDKIRCQCGKVNILVDEVVIEKDEAAYGNTDIDRPGIKGMMQMLGQCSCDVLIVRNLFDITDNMADWEHFINLLDDWGILIFSTDENVFLQNNYDVC